MGVRLHSKGLSSSGLLVWLHSNISIVGVGGEGVGSGAGLAHRMSLWLLRFLSLMVVVGVVVKVDWDEFGGEGAGTGAGAAHTELGVLSKLRLALLSSLLLLNTAFFANSHVGTASCNLLCFMGVIF